MINNKKLFQGWKSRAVVLTTCCMKITSNILAQQIFCRKVSAKKLINMDAPTLLKHAKLNPNDKLIWDSAYCEEYEGLEKIDTWETISEEAYQESKHLYKGLMPTMAIAVIKKDGNGNPV
jgi:hypothetical protein